MQVLGGLSSSGGKEGVTADTTSAAPHHPPTTSPSSSPTTTSPPYVPVPHHEALVASLVQLHSAGYDACLVGPRGCGKTAVITQAAAVLGYTAVEPILLYQVSQPNLT